MIFDQKRAWYNVKTREFGIMDIGGHWFAAGYSWYYCLIVHPCKTGYHFNLGCTGGELAKDGKWRGPLCPGIHYHSEPLREMTVEEIEEMQHEENGWVEIFQLPIKGEDENAEQKAESSD